MLIIHIPTILTVYLKLLNEIELEELIIGLQLIVRHFNKDIVLYSKELFNELHNSFFKLIHADENEDDDAKGDYKITGGVLKTIDKLLEISANTDVFQVLEEKVMDIIHWGFNPNNWEMQEDIFELILTLVKYSTLPSKRCWDFYPELLETVVGNETEVLNFKKDFPDNLYEGIGYESINDIVKIILQMILK